MLNFSIQDSLWVVFDTCTRPEYYQDVHNLLSVPRGWVLRYEYQEKYLTEDVVAAIRKGDALPSAVLLLYAQAHDYTRAKASSPTISDPDSTIWMPTRLGNMVNVIEDGKAFFFDFEVAGYPSLSFDSQGLCKKLYALGKTPFQKYITFIARDDQAKALAGGADEDNWHAIVDQLSATPSQFAGDVFWRIAGLRRAGSTDIVYPKQTKELSGKEIRQIRTHYELMDASTYSMEITTKRSLHDRDGGDHLKPFAVEAQVTDKDIVRIINPQINVRQYTAAHMEIESQNLAFPQSRLVELSLDTSPKEGTWPQGPDLKLRLNIKKNILTMVVALIALSMGGALGVNEVRELVAGKGEWITAVAVVASALLIVLGATLWTGKLSTK